MHQHQTWLGTKTRRKQIGRIDGQGTVPILNLQLFGRTGSQGMKKSTGEKRIHIDKQGGQPANSSENTISGIKSTST